MIVLAERRRFNVYTSLFLLVAGVGFEGDESQHAKTYFFLDKYINTAPIPITAKDHKELWNAHRNIPMPANSNMTPAKVNAMPVLLRILRVLLVLAPIGFG